MHSRTVYQSESIRLSIEGTNGSKKPWLKVTTQFGDSTESALSPMEVCGLREALDKLPSREKVWVVPFNDRPEGIWILEVRAQSKTAAIEKARKYLAETYVGRPGVQASRVRLSRVQSSSDIVERGEEGGYDG